MDSHAESILIVSLPHAYTKFLKEIHSLPAMNSSQINKEKTYSKDFEYSSYVFDSDRMRFIHSFVLLLYLRHQFLWFCDWCISAVLASLSEIIRNSIWTTSTSLNFFDWRRWLTILFLIVRISTIQMHRTLNIEVGHEHWAHCHFFFIRIYDSIFSLWPYRCALKLPLKRTFSSFWICDGTSVFDEKWFPLVKFTFTKVTVAYVPMYIVQSSKCLWNWIISKFKLK